MIRALCIAGGLMGAAGLSQAPEFSQQYLQRVSGQLDELTRDLKQLDAIALDLRMGREERLEQMANTPTFAADAAYWRVKIARHAQLHQNVTLLRAATPLQRIAMPHRMSDRETVTAVWTDFTPAVPVSTAGAAAAGTGFVAGWAVVAALMSLVMVPFRWIRRTPAKMTRREPGVRRDPPVARPTLVTDPANHRPKLAGVRR